MTASLSASFADSRPAMSDLWRTHSLSASVPGVAHGDEEKWSKGLFGENQRTI